MSKMITAPDVIEAEASLGENKTLGEAPPAVRLAKRTRRRSVSRKAPRSRKQRHAAAAGSNTRRMLRSQMTITGDKIHMNTGDVHWSALHDAVTEARGRVMKALGSMAAIDEDKSLSATGKADKRRAVAEAAIASFEKSKHLEKARSAVEDQVKRWDEKLGLTPKAPEGVGDAMIHAEIRSHLASLKTGDRMAFIDAHASEVAAAVLTAPSFLSGLTTAELGIVKQRIEARANPEIAEAKAETAKALAHAEQGWRAAIRQINDRAGLGKLPHDGIARAAAAIDAA